MDYSPPGSSIHGDSPGKSSGVGFHCPPPGDLPNLGIKPTSLTSPALAGGFFTASTTWEAHNIQKSMKSALKGENEGSIRILRGYRNIKLVALGRLFLCTSV